MNSLTPISATVGGALIGLGAGILWIVYGRLANISGLLGDFLSVNCPNAPLGRFWPLLFFIGIPIGSAAGLWLGPGIVSDMPTDTIDFDVGPFAFAAAGLMVGIGGALARSDWTDPGIFGMALLSPRSIVAAGIALGLAFITVFVERHLL